MFLRASDYSKYYRSPTRGQRTMEEPVGIVYGNGRPIGFLQPYGSVYQISSEEESSQPFKREFSDNNSAAIVSDEQQAFNKYNSEYPAVLTNFKIDSRLKNRELPIKRQYPMEAPKIFKREVGLTRRNVDRLKEALQNYKETPESKASLEEVLGEMGFAEIVHGLQKRESALEEDEDMEKGENAIRLVKETHDVEKRKSANKKPAKQKEAKVTEGDSLAEDEDGEEDEEELGQNKRGKRNDNSTQSLNNELMRNLAKSGDLTVSGNKSPLASAAESTNDDQQINDKDTISETDEERVAREIQEKIDAIKDQVKRQIAEAKLNDNGERKKREVKNLLKAETLEINPQYNNAEENGANHVRRKRNLESSSTTTAATITTTSSEDHDRDKRAIRIPLIPYHEEDVDLDTDHDESVDDGFEDRTSLTREKPLFYHLPRVVDHMEWENSLLYDDVMNSDNYVRSKRHNGEKRQKMFEHLNAVKERSEMPKDYPKRNEQGLKEAQDKLQQIADMSDADLFGPLPEEIPSELVRYKRVKRGPLEQKVN